MITVVIVYIAVYTSIICCEHVKFVQYNSMVYVSCLTFTGFVLKLPCTASRNAGNTTTLVLVAPSWIGAY